jgi:hypothetical protein
LIFLLGLVLIELVDADGLVGDLIALGVGDFVKDLEALVNGVEECRLFL